METELYIKRNEALNKLKNRLDLDLQSEWGKGFMYGIKEAIFIIQQLDTYYTEKDEILWKQL